MDSCGCYRPSGPRTVYCPIGDGADGDAAPLDALKEFFDPCMNISELINLILKLAVTIREIG